MSEGADLAAQTCENSHATLNPEDDPENLPPRTISYTGRRPRFGTGNVPQSPYILIDGKKLRSALSLRKKWPPRRVSFPTNDSHLVTGYLEPANPWKLAENVSRADLISAYKESCAKHNTDPLQSVLGQLENIEISENRSDQLNLKGEKLDQKHSETLEEILKRVQFNKIDLEGTSLDEESSVILFDMMEYYESAKHLVISCNKDIGLRGWQACAHMIKKTQCLEQLEAKEVTLNEHSMSILSRALRLVCNLHVLKLENCGLSGRATFILVAALKMNTGIRELYLADNGLDMYDAIQLGSLLRLNNHLQLLDVSNNNIKDEGVRDMLEGLINQLNEDKDGKGLNVLILWNNRLTKNAAPCFSRILTFSKTLETLNIGQNALTDDLFDHVKDALKKNHTLLQLGMQSTEITCNGIVVLSDIIQNNKILQRIDLRDNSIQVTGVKALSCAMKENKNITQIDLDDRPRMRIQDGTLHEYMDLVNDIRGRCAENEKNRTLEESSDGSESPQHHSRFCSASSRKISLTCQTLPCSSPSTTPVQSDGSGRSMLEPKRASGGRLRSPAPSPIPSPVASPIPSPSRSRFVVSRVPESSLRSTDSSASSSPVTPPSLGSSPTFFPPTSGSSRFRVSRVESASTVPSPKSVVASAKGNVTIGFNFKLDTVESTDSDDSDSVFRSELETDGFGKRDTENPRKAPLRGESSLVPNVIVSETDVVSKQRNTDTSDGSTKNDSVEETRETTSGSQASTLKEKELCDVRDNQHTAPTELEGAAAAGTADGIDNYCTESTKSLESLERTVNRNNDRIDIVESIEPTSAKRLTNDAQECISEKASAHDALLDDMVEREAQVKENNSSVQKHTSSLEKLLELFQHPGSFFTDSTNISQMESKSTFQDSVNSIMAFGDKFHHYLKESKEKVINQGTCPWSSDESALPGKSKSIKPSSISQLSSFQSITNMLSSLKLDANLNLFEQNTKSSSKVSSDHENTIRSQDKISEKDFTVVHRAHRTDLSNNGKTKLDVYIEEDETDVSTSSKQSLPDDMQSKNNDGHTNKDIVLEESCADLNATLDSCSKSVHTRPLTNVPESKTTVCIPKLTNIPEYSELEVTEANVTKEIVEKVVEMVDTVVVEKTCDRISTDSINLTSDSKSSSCNITCDIKVINNVHTILEATESRTSSVKFHLNEKDAAADDSSTFATSNEASSFISDNQSDDTVNNTWTVCHVQMGIDVRETDRSSYEVTSIPSIRIHDQENRTAHISNTEPAVTTDTCHADNLTHENSTIVNSTEGPRESDVSCTPKDNNKTSNEDANADRPAPTLSTQRPTDTQELEKDEIPMTEDTTSKVRIIAELSALTKIADNVSEKLPENTSVPTLIFTHHKTSSNTSIEKEMNLAESEKSDAEDMIFCMTDISTDGASVDDELSPGTTSSNWSTGSNKSMTPLYDLPQASHSPTNLLIEKPEHTHRNSQDSGIGETSLSAAEDVSEAMHSQSRGSFQESIDSGIESECSSVYVKSTNLGIESSKEDAASVIDISTNDQIPCASVDTHRIEDIQITQDGNFTTGSTASCLILSSASSGIGEMDNVSIGLVTDESPTTAAESSPTSVRAASSK